MNSHLCSYSHFCSYHVWVSLSLWIAVRLLRRWTSRRCSSCSGQPNKVKNEMKVWNKLFLRKLFLSYLSHDQGNGRLPGIAVNTKYELVNLKLKRTLAKNINKQCTIFGDLPTHKYTRIIGPCESKNMFIFLWHCAFFFSSYFFLRHSYLAQSSRLMPEITRTRTQLLLYECLLFMCLLRE